jgi:hypothetical protein
VQVNEFLTVFLICFTLVTLLFLIVEEKEFITELTLRYLKQYPPSPQRPYGPIGTEWYLLPKNWIDIWRMFVGKNRLDNISLAETEQQQQQQQQSSSHSSGSTGDRPKSLQRKQLGGGGQAPGAIDNWTILKKSGARALLPGLVLGVDFEVVPPAVYAAFSAWYGGGPAVSRRVVFLNNNSNINTNTNCNNSISNPVDPASSHDDLNNSSNSISRSSAALSSPTNKNQMMMTEIEIYPLCVVLVDCDSHGRITGQPRELLFSRTLSIEEMIEEIAADKRTDTDRIRCWNYLSRNWKEQFILSPELSLQQANIQDGQTVLVESSLSDGSWPRSQLHAYLDNEEKQSMTAATAAAEGGEGGDESSASNSPLPVPDQDNDNDNNGSSSETGVVVVGKNYSKKKSNSISSSAVTLRRNNGLVGLDNLGNTCYLNSSLQALLHTDLLMEYFLSQSYLPDINQHNKHGFGGRVANIFGRLAADLWTTNSTCITPR